MSERLRRWWPVLKLLLVVAVVVGVGWHLLRILRNEELQRGDEARTPAEVLWDAIRSADLPGLVLASALYLAGLAFSAVFWIRLTRSTGETLPALPAVRCYYLSHLGKYVPGKGWALLMRTTMAADAGCRAGVAVLTCVYETLTTMAAGALLAAILLLAVGAWSSDHAPTRDGGLVWKALALLVLAGVPILPGVFNRVVELLVRRILRGRVAELPRLKTTSLLAGLVFAACGWLFLGASLEALLWSLAPETTEVCWQGLLRSTTFIAVSYVAGFIASTPGGLGVREFLLQQLLAPQLGARAVVVALLLRLLWTVAELVMAAAVWWLPRTTNQGEPPGSSRRPPDGGDKPHRSPSSAQ